MFESKYSKVLTVILVIVIIAILGLLGFLGYDWYKNYFLENDAEKFVQDYANNNQSSSDEGQNTTSDENATNPIDSIEKVENGSTSGNSKPQYKGFNVIGTMEIPATNFSYPILEAPPSKKAIETSVAMLYGAGVNQVGNTVIIGHNYRNGLFFSNNKKLNNGDKIYITDNDGNTLTYTIYNKFETTPEDTSFYQRDTNGKPEVTLSTCTDDSKERLIILARAD